MTYTEYLEATKTLENAARYLQSQDMDNRAISWAVSIIGLSRQSLGDGRYYR